MECVILIGTQGSGKSTFCRERFFGTHVRINLDMLRTRNREAILFDACLRAGQSCVIDNTNPTRSDRARYISAALEHGFRIKGYYFESKIDSCIARNLARPESERVPELGVRGTHARLELPQFNEAFSELSYVRIEGNGMFIEEAWKDEV